MKSPVYSANMCNNLTGTGTDGQTDKVVTTYVRTGCFRFHADRLHLQRTHYAPPFPVDNNGTLYIFLQSDNFYDEFLNDSSGIFLFEY